MNKIQKANLDIPLGNEKLKVKEFAKYLRGIYIDSKLTWEKQIQITNAKLRKGIGIIRTMRHFLQENQLKLLFSAFTSLYLDYGAFAWEGAAKTHVDKLDRSLRKTIRLMMFKDKKHIAKTLYKYLKILPLEEHPKIICDK